MSEQKKTTKRKKVKKTTTKKTVSKIAKIKPIREHDQFEKLIWQTHEFKKFEPNSKWFMLFFIVLAVIALFLIWLQLFTLLIGLIIAAFLIIIEISLEPRLVRVEIGDDDIKFGNKKFEYERIKYYGIVTHKQDKHLILHTTDSFLATIDIPLGKQSGEEVRLILSKHIPYVPQEKHPHERLTFWR